MVKIEDIKAEGFRRFLLGETNSIHYKPKSPYQIFIGPNGSGKSAFQRLLTPYLPKPADFYKNGELSIKFSTDDGNIYTDAHFGKTTTYEFALERGFNLNEGGTRGVQSDLHLSYLKSNQDTFDVMTDVITLTDMSPAKREEFLTRISGIDLEFALERYNNLRKLLRQKKGAFEEITTDLAKRQIEIVPESELKILEDRIEEYESDIVEMLKHSTNLTGAVSDDNVFYRARNQLINELKDLNKRVFYSPRVYRSSKSVAVDDQSELRDELTTLRERSRTMLERYDKDKGVLDFLKANQSDETVEERIERTRKDIGNIEHSLSAEIEHFGTVTTLDIERVKELEEKVSAVLCTLFDYQYTELSATVMERLTGDYHIAHNELSRVRIRKDELSHRITHIENMETTRCPSCNYRFRPNVSPDKLDEYKSEHDKLVKRETVLLSNIESMTQLKVSIDEYRNKVSFIMSYFHGNDICKKLLSYIERDWNMFENIGGSIERLNLTIDKLTYLSKLNQLKTSLADDLVVSEMMANLGVNKEYNSLLKDVTEQAKEIEKIEEMIRRKKSELDILTEGIDYNDRMENEINEKLNSIERYRQLESNELEILTNDLIDTMIDETKILVTSMRKTLNEQKIIHHEVKEYSRKLEDLTLDITATERMITYLSPKVGFIAEQMVGFVSNFIERMNDIISAIWTYPMEVLPGKTTGESLTYIFPVMVNDRANDLAQDVKDTSDGQKGIINYAFKITALLQMGMEGYPLHLDEVDREMTPTHKIKIMNHVRQLIENEVFSQVFIISHHESCFGALPNSEIIDLSPENVFKGANQNVTFYQKKDARD